MRYKARRNTNVYLGLSDLFIIHPEKEMNKGFADLALEPFLAQYPAIKYSYLIEQLRQEAEKNTAKAGANAFGEIGIDILRSSFGLPRRG